MEGWWFGIRLQPQDLDILMSRTQPWPPLYTKVFKAGSCNRIIILSTAAQKNYESSQYEWSCSNAPIKAQTSTWLKCCGGALGELYITECHQTSVNWNKIVKKLKFSYVQLQVYFFIFKVSRLVAFYCCFYDIFRSLLLVRWRKFVHVHVCRHVSLRMNVLAAYALKLLPTCWIFGNRYCKLQASSVLKA